MLLLDVRARARTVWPRSTSRRATCQPTKPEAPVTRVGFIQSFSFDGQARLLQRSPAAIQRNRILIAHLPQVVCNQRGTESAAAIKDQSRFLVRNLSFDIALDHALAHVDRTFDVARGEF